MVSKVIVSRDICWPREAYQLILNQVKKQPAKDFLKNQLLKYQIPSQSWADLYQYFKEVESEFNSSLTEEDLEILEKYFSIKNEEVGCMGDLLLFFDELNINESMEEFKLRMTNLTQDEIDVGFDQRLLGAGNGMGEIDEGILEAKSSTIFILQHIAGLKISDQQKWQIQEVYVNFREHSQNIITFLQTVCRLMTKNITKLDPYLDEFQEYWTKTLETQCVNQILRDDLQLDIDENPMGCVIHPILMEISTIKIAENGEAGEARGKTNFGLGILFGKDYGFSRKVDDKHEEQDLFIILKILSDKSKFEILKFVADDWRYGSEIAKTMKLTSATISYHMHTLVQARLVEIKKEEKKVFFRQNKKYLSEMLQFCEKAIQKK